MMYHPNTLSNIDSIFYSTTNYTYSQHTIAKLVEHIKHPDATRSSAENLLLEILGDETLENQEEILEASLNLVVSILLMVPIQCVLTGHSITGETKLRWKDGTLQNLVNQQFVPQIEIKETVKLDRIFNARNIERIAGIKIRWTSNLADHLRMRDDDKTVDIFHYASFLKLNQSW